jgi:hypothetical protein
MWKGYGMTKKVAMVMMWCLLLTGVVLAAKPFFAFDTTVIKPVPTRAQAWHPQFEKDSDYGESWFSMVQADSGAVLFAMVTITNLGLKTFDGIIDVNFYDPAGKAHYFHKELKRDSVTASTAAMDTTVGPARVWGGKGQYHLTLTDDAMSIKLDVASWLPTAMFGDGAVRFFSDKSAEWTLGMTVPYGRSTGELTTGGRTFNLAGYVYSDHGYATIKMPDFVRTWRTLRAYKGKRAIVMHDLFFTKKFDEKELAFGVFTADGKTMLPMREISFKPTAFRKDKSKYDVPTAYDLSFKAGDYTVSGKVNEKRFLDGVDVLGQVSWPVRVLIKAFYANPFMFRSTMTYELSITAADGTVENLSGSTVVESNVF